MPDFGGYRPHYQGYGTTTAGGRGGVLHRVTNLNDAGVGSLRAALEATGARCVVFETSGRIQLTSPIEISNPFLTVAGQTAPAPGITISHQPIVIDTTDVVLQHFRIRLGTASGYTFPNQTYALRLLGNVNAVLNIVLDHLSLAWATSTILSMQTFLRSVTDVSVLDCLIAEAMDPPYPPPNHTENNGALWLVGALKTGTFARNLTAHVDHRTPWLAAGTRFSGLNNVAYNARSVSASVNGFFTLMSEIADGFGNPPPPIEAVWIGNVTIAGAQTGAASKAVLVGKIENTVTINQLYLADNTGPFQTLANQWGGVDYYNFANEANTRIDTVPTWHSAFNYEVLANASVEASVRASAGARPNERNDAATRDGNDYRVVQDVLNRTGAIPGAETDAAIGGYPVVPVNTRAYVDPASPNAIAPGETFRTNREVYLESLAVAVESLAGAGTSGLRMLVGVGT